MKRLNRIGLAGLLLGTMFLTGCASFAKVYEDDNPCQPEYYSDSWWAMKSSALPGSRQKCCKGKMWPPYPRPHGEKQQFSHKFHHAHYWPWPYNCQDRAYVSMVSDLQVHAGWERETTLYDYHFNPETNELLHCGYEHLRWIIQDVPYQHRAIFIQASGNPEADQIRLANVQIESANYLVDGDMPAVALRVGTPYGRPAREIQAIRELELSSQPAPRITYSALPVGN